MTRDTPVDVAETVETFIRKRFEVSERDTYFDREVNLWDGGYVDSLGMTELIAFLETMFRIELPDSALFSPDFRNIDGIARLVTRLADSAAPSAAPRAPQPLSARPM
jgi:acyl carrier protein